jgi:hypothetical protein
MGFNPSAPTLMGLQWPVTREGVQRVDSDFAVAAAYFTSSVSETIHSIWFWLTSAQNSFVTNDTGYEVEIYDASLLDAGVEGFTEYNPTVDAVTYNMYNDIGPSSPPHYTHVDEGMGASNQADWAACGFGSQWGIYGMRFGGLAGSLTGKVINKVTLRSYARALAFGGTPTLGMTPFYQQNGFRSRGQPVAMDSENALYEFNQEWSFNPITRTSWKIADLELLASDADTYIGYEFAPTGSVNWVQQLFTVGIRVDWSTTERRVACGRLVAYTPQNPRAYAYLRSPAGVVDWAKTAGKNYLVVLRRRAGNGSITVRWLDSGAACPHQNHGSAIASFRASGCIDSASTDVTNRLTPAYGLAMLTSGGTGSPDTQPYNSANGDAGTGEATYDWTQLHTTNVHQQEFTPTATASYQSIQILVRGASSLAPPDGDLLVKVKRRSDNVQIGGTLTITPSQLKTPYNSWRTIRGNITAAALTSGVQYYFEITAPNATAAAMWNVQVLSAIQADANYDQYGFGGMTDRLTWGVFTDIQMADAVVSIAQAITNVTGFAAAAQDLALTTLSGPSPSRIVNMKKIRLTWTKTNLGVNFMRYEIDRLNTITGNWENIARITAEASQAMDDVEAPVGILASYRIRTIHINGAASDWSTTATATPTWGNYGSGLLFVSNEDTTLSCGYLMNGSVRDYAFLNAETVEMHKFQGRDYQVAFRDLEKRGMRVEASLFVNFESTPTAKGARIFQPLRNIADADLSYVAVKNKDGEVWYVSLVVGSGMRDEPGNFYTADISMVQVVDLPSIVDV